jgi:hypothetical protein
VSSVAVEKRASSPIKALALVEQLQDARTLHLLTEQRSYPMSRLRWYLSALNGTLIALPRVSLPSWLIVRLKITRQPSGSIDGIQLDDFIVGFTYDVGTMLACYLLAERFAEPVLDENPALVIPARTQTRFAGRSSQQKTLPIAEKQLHTAMPQALSEAADQFASRRKRRRR